MKFAICLLLLKAVMLAAESTDAEGVELTSASGNIAVQINGVPENEPIDLSKVIDIHINEHNTATGEIVSTNIVQELSNLNVDEVPQIEANIPDLTAPVADVETLPEDILELPAIEVVPDESQPEIIDVESVPEDVVVAQIPDEEVSEQVQVVQLPGEEIVIESPDTAAYPESDDVVSVQSPEDVESAHLPESVDVAGNPDLEVVAPVQLPEDVDVAQLPESPDVAGIPEQEELAPVQIPEEVDSAQLPGSVDIAANPDTEEIAASELPEIDIALPLPEVETPVIKPPVIPGDIVTPESAVPEDEAKPSTGEIHNDGIVSITLNRAQTLYTSVSSWINIVYNYVSDNGITTTNEIV